MQYISSVVCLDQPPNRHGRAPETYRFVTEETDCVILCYLHVHYLDQLTIIPKRIFFA